ncbi:MAG: hypothetical protein CVV44_22365 [Spirochaetae bacterium HGW-Spirochaetae-1]|jgi:hypothetical protein|nr:MAG: hypothetical protein CVV44_22365 [Spirochaetae bacterium HGW-Spirochaetae-1]
MILRGTGNKPALIFTLAVVALLFLNNYSVQAAAKTWRSGDASLIVQSSEDYDKEYTPENTDQPESDNQYNPDETIEEVPSEEGSEEVPESNEEE